VVCKEAPDRGDRLGASTVPKGWGDLHHVCPKEAGGEDWKVTCLWK